MHELSDHQTTKLCSKTLHRIENALTDYVSYSRIHFTTQIAKHGFLRIVVIPLLTLAYADEQSISRQQKRLCGDYPAVPPKEDGRTILLKRAIAAGSIPPLCTEKDKEEVCLEVSDSCTRVGRSPNRGNRKDAS